MARQAKGNRFTVRMQKKLVVLFMIVLLAFVGLTYRLFTISRDNGERYKKQILSQQKYDSTTIPYKEDPFLTGTEAFWPRARRSIMSYWMR